MKAFAWITILVLAAPLARSAQSPTCTLKNRHLVVETQGSDQTTFNLVLNDYSTLAGNPSLNWDVDGGSFSSVEVTDRFGFVWSPSAVRGSGKGRCKIQMNRREHSLDLEIACQELVSRDGSVPGYLNPAAVEAHCPID